MSADDLKPGMKGYGLSVFKGTKIERFDVEILGVEKKVLAGQDMIQIRMSGMGLEYSGTVAGMSGSPVYIDGRLIGAVAYADWFQKDPIAGVTPIADMLKALEEPGPPGGAGARGALRGETDVAVSRMPPSLGQLAMRPIPTPLMIGGFTAGIDEETRGFLESAGLAPMNMGGAAEDTEHPEADNLQPGAAISVPMMMGDLRMTAVGTVTYREGDRVLAFGHPFLNSGPSEMPMGGAVVHTIMPSYMNSYKASSPTRITGGLLADRQSAIMGRLGVFHKLIPMKITISKTDTGKSETLNVKVLRSDIYTLRLLRFAVRDAIERALGDYPGQGTVNITLDGKFEGYPKPFHFEDRVFHTATAYTIGALDHVLYISDNKFRKVQIEELEVKLDAERRIRLAEIQKITLSGSRFKPGGSVGVNVHLRRYDGGEFVKSVSVKIPQDTAPGPLLVLVEGGENIGLQYRVTPVNFEQFYDRAMEEWVPGNRLSVRLVFRDLAAGVEGEELPLLPGSVQAALQTGLPGEIQTMPRSIQELFVMDDIIRGTAQTQINVEKEFGQ